VVCAFFLFPALVRAAQPGSGTLLQLGQHITWTGGPLASVSPSPQACIQGVSCDGFTVDLAIPPDKVAQVRVRIDWSGASNDFDLFVFDAQGNLRGSSTAGGTIFEETVVTDLPPGSYRVVANAFTTVNASYSGSIALESLGNPPSDPRFSTRLSFNEGTLVDFSATSGEPFIRLDGRDRVFVSAPFGVSTTVSLLWRSVDGGRSYISLGTPGVRDAVTGPGGGDTHQDFDADGSLYYVDLSAACVTAAVSPDGGETFPPERTNPVVCVSDENPGAAVDDRQWVAAFGEGIGYVSFRNLAGSPFWLFKTRDGGLTWDGGTRLGTVSQSGPLQVDKARRAVVVDGVAREAIHVYQVYYRGTNLRLFRVTDFDDGSPLRIEDLSIADPGASVSNVFPVLAIDTAGNLYAAWSQSASAIYMAVSTDRGATWSQPIPVGNLAGTNIMPWIVAGDPGRVDIVWYHSQLAGNPDVPENEWHVVMAQSLNALHKKPGFTLAQVTNNVVHRGEICLEGLQCDVDGRDRSFLEFPSIDIDSRGRAFIAYNDNTNQVEAPYVMVARQIDGPGLFKTVDTGSTDSASVSRPASGEAVGKPSARASGGHQLAPENFDRDEAGDARFPDHGAVVGSNVPALDILSTVLSADSQTVTARIQVADLSTQALAVAPALSGGDGLLYLAQWDYGDDIRWVAAEIRAGLPVFYTGTLGLVQTTSKKFITYNPDPVASLQVTGDLGVTAPGTITLRVPRSLVGNPPDGARFFSVTAYTFSERGPLVPLGTGAVPNPASLLRVDASGAFGYAVGEAPRHAGLVELSVDDPGFATPQQAQLGIDGTWQADLATAGLAPGAHTLSVRQRPNGGTPSSARSISFLVP
jgi:hypothetical protein